MWISPKTGQGNPGKIRLHDCSGGLFYNFTRQYINGRNSAVFNSTTKFLLNETFPPQQSRSPILPRIPWLDPNLHDISVTLVTNGLGLFLPPIRETRGSVDFRCFFGVIPKGTRCTQFLEVGFLVFESNNSVHQSEWRK